MEDVWNCWRKRGCNYTNILNEPCSWWWRKWIYVPFISFVHAVLSMLLWVMWPYFPCLRMTSGRTHLTGYSDRPMGGHFTQTRPIRVICMRNELLVIHACCCHRSSLLLYAKKMHKNYANTNKIQSVAGERWRGLETNMMTMFEFSGLICLKYLDISIILTDWVSWEVDS